LLVQYISQVIGWENYTLLMIFFVSKVPL